MEQQLTLDNIKQQENLFLFTITISNYGRWSMSYSRCTIDSMVTCRYNDTLYNIILSVKQSYSNSWKWELGNFTSCNVPKTNELPYIKLPTTHGRFWTEYTYLCTSFKAALLAFSNDFIKKGMQERFVKKRKRIYKAFYTEFLTTNFNDSFFLTLK